MGICVGEREGKIHWASRRPHHPSSCIIKLLRPLMNSAWNEPTKLSILINYYPKRYEEKKRERGRVTGGKREGKEECSRALSCLQLLLGNLHLMTTMRKQNTYQIICNKFHTHTDSTQTHTYAIHTHTHNIHTHSCIGGPVKLSVIKVEEAFSAKAATQWCRLPFHLGWWLFAKETYHLSTSMEHTPPPHPLLTPHDSLALQTYANRWTLRLQVRFSISLNVTAVTMSSSSTHTPLHSRPFTWPLTLRFSFA